MLQFKLVQVLVVSINGFLHEYLQDILETVVFKEHRSPS